MAILVALFIVVPIVELYVIIQIGGLIGIWPTIALLLADAILGSMLLRQQGRSAWRRFNAALAERRFPALEVADGLLIAIGGTLLLTPGFITDIVGLLFLIPPTRAIVRRMLKGIVGKRILLMGGPAGTAYGAASAGSRAYGYARGGRGEPGAGGASPSPNGAQRDDVVDGTAEEIEGDDPQLGR
jgi:UPF0716 protein FxsA